MIEIQNLTKQYGRIKAVDNISFTVDTGEIVGFLGPNGAGKTTTMNIITGYIPSTDGTAKVGGFDVMEDPEKVKKKIGYLPEQPPLYNDLTVFDYLSFVSDIKRVPKNKKYAQINDIMELVKVADHRKRLIKNLSKGYKQRVGLAQALIGEPELLILDEPTVGLDPKQIMEMRKLIKALGKKHTIILSSHILQEVSAVCERVIIINKGRIAAIDTPTNLSKGMVGSSKLSVTICGPSQYIMNNLKDITGIKRVEKLSENEKDVASFLVEADKEIDIRKSTFFAMAKLGYPIVEMRSMDMSLEDIFLQLVTNETFVATDNEGAADNEGDADSGGDTDDYYEDDNGNGNDSGNANVKVNAGEEEVG